MALLAELADILCSVSLGEIGTLLETRTGYGTLLNWCIIWVSSLHPNGEKVAEGQLKGGAPNCRIRTTAGRGRSEAPVSVNLCGMLSPVRCPDGNVGKFFWPGVERSLWIALRAESAQGP